MNTGSKIEKNVETSVKTNNKNVEFYRLYMDYYPLFDNNNKCDDLIRFLSLSLGKNVEVSVRDNSNYSVYIIDVDKDKGVFGMIGKKHNMKYETLSRIVSKENDEPIDTSKLIIEHFTYFYMRFSDYKISVISNMKAPKFEPTMNAFLKNLNKDGRYKQLEIIRMTSEIKELKNKAKSLSKIKFIMSGDKVENDDSYLNIFDISETNLISVSTTCKIKPKPLKSNDLEKLENKEYLSSKFDKLFVTFEGDSDEVFIDLLKDFITLKVFIPGLEKKLKSHQDLDVIKEALIDSFNKLFWFAR